MMEERQPEALMRRIHEEMVQADLFEIAMISRLSKRLLKIRKPKATEKKPVDQNPQFAHLVFKPTFNSEVSA